MGVKAAKGFFELPNPGGAQFLPALFRLASLIRNEHHCQRAVTHQVWHAGRACHVDWCVDLVIEGMRLFVSARLPQALMDQVGHWATSNEASRSEAIRQLIELGLKAKAK
jgi:hypothetical protein